MAFTSTDRLDKTISELASGDWLSRTTRQYQSTKIFLFTSINTGAPIHLSHAAFRIGDDLAVLNTQILLTLPRHDASVHDNRWLPQGDKPGCLPPLWSHCPTRESTRDSSRRRSNLRWPSRKPSFLIGLFRSSQRKSRHKRALAADRAWDSGFLK